ncbi:MAG: hypothetical protein KKF89_05185 [Nanoarchaeota archaeon]|nr:hypothetical protein [Nanoarchaeota archaeon]MBU1855088.1 hypothetical protein [Nanoarchaeota archaeon]
MIQEIINPEEEFEALKKTIIRINNQSNNSSIDEVIVYYDFEMSKSRQTNLYINKFMPAVKNLSDKITEELAIIDDSEETCNHKELIIKTFIRGAEEYFKIANPIILEAVSQEPDNEEKLEFLIQTYDKQLEKSGRYKAEQQLRIDTRLKNIGSCNGNYSQETFKDIREQLETLKEISEKALNNKRYGVETLKKDLYQQQVTHTTIIQSNHSYNEAIKQLRSIEQIELANYIKEELNKTSFKVSNPSIFFKANVHELMLLRDKLQEGMAINVLGVTYEKNV